ncbi:MAG: ester cyclase [Candidatus Binataceae bacterium]
MPTAKQLGDQQIAAAINGDWNTLRRLYSDDLQYVDPDGEVRGIEAAIARLQSQEGPLSNMSFEMSTFVADELHAVAEWTFTATNTGPLMIPGGTTIPATNRTMTIGIMTIYDVRNGRIVSERSYWDNLSIYAQLRLPLD